MKEFTVHKPAPQPTRYTCKFSYAELVAILTSHLEDLGVHVPKGKTFLTGLDEGQVEQDDEGDGGFHRSRGVTLVIDA